MESLTVDQIISLIIVFISLLLTIFLLTAKTKNAISNIFLALFLLANAQDSSGLLASYLLYPTVPGWGMILNSTVFFKMPLLYLYLLSVIYSDFKLRWIHLWHVLPWVLNFLVFMPRYYAVDFDAKWEFLSGNGYRENFEIQFSYIAVHIQITVYLVLSYFAINRYRKLLVENFWNASLFNYKWLCHLMTIIGGEWAFGCF